MKRFSKMALWMALLLWPLQSVAGNLNCRLELDHRVLSADQKQKAILMVTVESDPQQLAGPRPPVNLAVVLDSSGSMSGQKLLKAKEATLEAVRQLGAQDIFSLITYSHQIKISFFYLLGLIISRGSTDV